MKILIYEDEKARNMSPLSMTRCVFELRSGFYSLFDRIAPVLPEGEKGLWVREYLKGLAGAKYGMSVNEGSFFLDDLLLVNGRWLRLREGPLDAGEEKVVQSGGEIVYALIKKETAVKLWNGDFEEFLKAVSANVKAEQTQAAVLEYPWQLISFNPEALEIDFQRAGKTGIKGDFSLKAAIAGDEAALFIAEKTRVHPFAVIDTQGGPVYVEEGAEIFPFARIEGPCYIGGGTHIMPGSSIREGCSFGPVCKIGGEVEESIFHSYSNKYHDGFIGHSYIGEFVNLGALTTNSDLKNDYGSISVYQNGSYVDTGDMKVGSFVGDHTKTSIGTLFNTGTVAGVMCNITAGGILPKYFPSFSWHINGRFMKGYGLEMMLNTAKTVMERRDKILAPEQEDVFRFLYEMTAGERKEFVKKSRRRQ